MRLVVIEGRIITVLTMLALAVSCGQVPTGNLGGGVQSTPGSIQPESLVTSETRPSATPEQGGQPTPTRHIVQPTSPDTSTTSIERVRFPQNRDAPPEGVSDQLAFGFGGGASCSIVSNPNGKPVIALYDVGFRAADIFEVGNLYNVCFSGFISSKPVDVRFTFPNGASEQSRAKPEDGIQWIVLPTEPTGVYSVTASQGLIRARTKFTVVPASEPRVLVWPKHARPGTEFGIVVAGFAPNQTVPLHLYGADKDCRSRGNVIGAACYIAKLQEVHTNKNGGSIFILSTKRDDPTGSYIIDTEPSSYDLRDNTGGQFWLANE